MIEGMLLPDSSESHQDSLVDIADTIQQVGDLIVENWTSPLRDLNFLGPVNWSHITATAPMTAKIGSSTMCDILVKQNQIIPNKVAVESWDGNLTYAELYDVSCRMATALLRTGVSREERIGIYMKKSKWSIVAFWGILLAGCTGVPLDIRNPRSRTEALLRRVDARCVVADEWTSPQLEELDVNILHVGLEGLRSISISSELATSIWPQLSPWTVAFILFTSGSTGLPKGVIVEHGPLYTSIVKIAEELFLDETSRTFQFSSFVSDASMGDIFSTMIQGGCVCVPSEEERLDNLPRALDASMATHVCLTSSVMSQIQPEDVPHLQYMIAIGEALSKENFLRWSPHLHVISAYGIAESIIYDSFATQEHLSSDYRNIGMAKGPCLWVADQNDPEKLKPIGAVGEILIEGPLLARGYMNDPTRTAERFIQAPKWLQEIRRSNDRANHRCYRSGDYGIRNADGTVLYLGRADTQVKIRGQRVELGEIEHNLLVSEPLLDQVAVELVKLQNRENEEVLVAFVKHPGPAEDNVNVLSLLRPVDEASKEIFLRAQSKLLEFLPRYMVPSIFIPVMDIPKSTVGKRNRNTLREWGSSLTEDQLVQYQMRHSTTNRPPETPEEILLCQIWANVLRAPKVSLGIDDNFFQVGGDSIKAIELVAALRDRGRVLTVNDVFQTPDMSEMALLLGYVDEENNGEPPKPFELIPNSISKHDCVQDAAQLCHAAIDMIEDIYPATPMQEALMAISAHRPNVYTHRVVFKIPEQLDIVRYKKAWEILVREQPIFRTSIVTLPGAGTLQVVLCSNIDWHMNLALDEYVQYDGRTPFTYGSALSRYAIVRDDKNALYFVWSGHHAISDGWSRPVMLDEVKHIYYHGVARPQSSYTPFIRYINHLDLEESDEFWKSQFPDTIESFPRLPNVDYSPQAHRVQTTDVKMNRHGQSKITTATLIQAAWALVTATYSNTDEAVFGLTLSGRDTPVPGITKMMGITITTIPVRLVLDNTCTIEEYLHDVQQYLLQVKQHQHIGLQRIHRLNHETRSAANFQNLLVIQPADEEKDYEAFEEMGLQVVQREENDTQDHALTVQCTINNEDGVSLRVRVYYDDNVLTGEHIQGLLCYFDHIINQLATESTDQTLYDVDRMSRHDLGLYATLNAQMPATVDKTLHGLFEEQARATPDEVAIEGFDGILTYAELDRISNQLASHLKQITDIGLESRVVLCFSKSRIPIITMLAVLKSGGVCVSVNPEHPTIRLLDMIKDVESSILLCDAENADRFKDQGPLVIGITESLLTEIKSATSGPIRSPKVLPNNASFVVYTSGSTGKPKGSVLEHKSLATDLTALGQRIELSENSRTLQFSAYTFDAHILEIFGTFIHGGCVCVISDHERMNNLSDVINTRNVNFALLTKTVSRLLEPDEVPTLQTLILSGEPNGRQDYVRWARRLRLFNGLGPSECTPLVCVTRDPVAPEDDPANIGHSMGCHVWITDHRRPDRLVPIGCVGELTVEGPIVGRGYVNRPKETAASFIQDPAWSLSMNWSARPRRFYRSGDLAKMNFDGSITFIGRADNQVKIHGQRLELGEIEDHIRRCNSAFTALAVDTLTISSRGGATALAVYWISGRHRRNTTATDGSGNAQSIQLMDEETYSECQKIEAELSRLLPRYMVPSIFIPVKYLPFNASGKLERKTLRQWVAVLDADEFGQYYLNNREASRATETVNEKRLQGLWAKILGIPINTIRAEDNFFRLGGDSVLSMKLIANARAEGITMTVADVFKMPVLKDIALSLVNSEDTSDRKPNNTSAVEPMSLLKGKVVLDTLIEETSNACGVTPDLIEDIYPCNPTQEALMAVSSHRPKAYTYQVVLKLPQSMDLEKFKSAWDMLVTTWPIYRTRIIYQRGMGSLQVALRSKIKWHTVTGLSLEEYIERETVLLVEYGKELCRFAIVQTDSENIFVATLHHALYDGWSLLRTYEAFRGIFETGKAQIPIVPYTRFFQHISTIDQKESDDFWRAQFPNIIRSYPQLPSGDYVPRPQHTKISSIGFSRKPGSEVTLATIIQTAWAILMSKYSECDEVVFGLTLSGRDAPIDGITDIIGPTTATVPVRIALDQKMTLADLLNGIQKKTIDIKKYQNAGLQRIRRLSPEASAAADFRNLLIVHTMGDAEITTPLNALGLQVEKSRAEEFLDIALTVECTIRPDTLQVMINYDSVIVPHGQVDFMLHQIEHIASFLVEEPKTTKLNDIDLASPYDLEHLDAWNSAVPEPMLETLHGLFEVQVRATPNAIATCSFDDEYTYKELNAAADKLAAYLTSLDVGPEKCVVLCFRKSTWAIVSILAVLKSGGVCVSVNYEHPLHRRLDICDDVKPMVVLCDSEWTEQFSTHAQHVVAVDSALFSTILAHRPVSDWVRPEILPSSAAFIVYTSGSTGKPKGCILEHHSVCLSQKMYATTTNVTNKTRTLQFAAYSFDAHILEIFGTLIHGGCVCVVPDAERMNNLTAAINTLKATRLLQTPTVAQLLDPEALLEVDTIILGAEPLTQKSIETWSTTARDVQMIQHYAPAETSNLGTLNFELGEHKDPTNIGRTYGCAAWITERDNPDRLSPIGCLGELLIEGPALGRGYLNRPDATWAAFIEEPTWSRNRKLSNKRRRFYRTGDIACYNHDGTIKFVGRVDTQVKIHGQRVELREIEHQVLKQLPPGCEVVVEIVNLTNAATLTAFIRLPTFITAQKKDEDDMFVNDEELRDEFIKTVQTLEERLPERLPQYMVPSAFVPVSFMPISASTKIERKKLKQFAEQHAQGSVVISGTSLVKEQPTTSIEASLQLVWGQILNQNISDIGTGDTFMSLGGDSISAMQAVSECRKLGISLQVSTILEQKTIANIAPHCTIKSSFDFSSLSGAADGVLFDLSPIQKLYFNQELGEWRQYNQSFFCRLKRHISADELSRAFSIIVGRHAMLRARFTQAEESRQWMQYTVPRTPECYRFKSHNPMHMQNGASENNIATFVNDCARESVSSINITSGPIFSVDFFNFPGRENTIYMTAHHLVIDHDSWRIIWRDLEEILRSNNLQADLSPPISFQDWVSHQNRSFEGVETPATSVYPMPIPATQFDFWGVPIHENIIENTVEQSFSLPADITELFLGQSNNALRTTPLDILVGLLVQSFKHVFKDRDVPSVFIEHHGRQTLIGHESVDLSETVGWFTSLYPVHIPITTSTTPNEAIRLAKDTRHLIPRNGQPYFAFCQLSLKGNQFAHHTPAELVVNTSSFEQLKTDNSLVQLESDIIIHEQERDPKSRRFAMIDLEVGVSRGVMEFSFHLHKDMAHIDKIKKWISNYRSGLLESLQVLATEAPIPTLSDFPHLKVSYEDLGDLWSKLPQFGLNTSQHGLIQDIYPCTAMQEGILLSQQRDAEVYRIQHVWEFSEDLSLRADLPTRLAQVWQSIVRKHSSLRTGIVEHANDKGHFIQVVLKDLPSSRFIEAKDMINDLSEIKRTPQQREDSFWLHVPQLTVYHTKNGRIACGLKLSHVLVDGVSLDIFMNSLVSELTGHTSPSSAMDFGDYVEYEQRMKSDESLAYWTSYLKDVEPCHIPTVKGKEASMKQREYAYIKIPDNATKGLSTFCQGLGVTQAVVLLTAWAVVLRVFTGQDDVCFGYIASDRDAPLDGIEESIGLFLSMQLFRMKLGDRVVKDVMQDVHNQVISSLKHRNCSLALIQSMLGLKSTPLFNTCMTIKRALDDATQSRIDDLLEPGDGTGGTEVLS